MDQIQWPGGGCGVEGCLKKNWKSLLMMWRFNWTRNDFLADTTHARRAVYESLSLVEIFTAFIDRETLVFEIVNLLMINLPEKNVIDL